MNFAADLLNKIKNGLIWIWKFSTEFPVYSLVYKLGIKEAGKIFLGVFILIALLVTVIQGGLILWDFKNNPRSDIFSFPGFTIENKILKVKDNKSYIFKEDSLNLKIVIDSGKKIKDKIEENAPNYLIFAEDGLIMKSLNRDVYAMEYPDWKEPRVIDGGVIKKMYLMMFVFFLISLPLFFIVINVLNSLFLALLSTVVIYPLAQIGKYKFSFLEIFIVSLMVNVPAFIYSNLINIVGLGFDSLYVVVYFIFLFIGFLYVRIDKIKLLNYN